MSYNPALSFYRQAQARPEKMALVIGGQAHTYGKTAEHAARIAAWLGKGHPVAKTRVGLLCGRTPGTYWGLLGTAWSGHCYVPLPPKFPAAYLKGLLRQAEIGALIIDATGADLLRKGLLQGIDNDIQILWPENPSGLSISGMKVDGGDSLSRLSSLPAPVSAEKDDPVYIMFTSGTTGTPKGIAATAGNVEHFLEATQKRYGLRAEDRVSQFNDLHWDPSIFDLFSAWRVGASVHVVPESQLLLPLHFIKAERLTVWYSAPAQIGLLNRAGLLKADSLTTLRLSLFVGEPLTHEAAAAWQKAAPNSLVENVYGPTETTVVCTGQPYDGGHECLTPERDYVALGRPYWGMHLGIVDAQHHFIPPPGVGEIAIAGPQVTPGYWRNPVRTAEQFLRLQHPELGLTTWYLTGDRGYQDAGGIFHFLGRIDNQVQLLGKRIELEEVESHLREVACCDDVAVFAWPVINGSAQSLYAFASPPSLDQGALLQALKQRLPSYMVPKQIFVLERLPRNRNRKIDRRHLLEMLEKTA